MGQEGIHYLRAFGNSDSIREDLAARPPRDAASAAATSAARSRRRFRATAATARSSCSKTCRSRARSVDELGAWTQRHLERLGVQSHPGESLARFDGDGERVTSVVCESRPDARDRHRRDRRRRASGHDARARRRASRSASAAGSSRDAQPAHQRTRRLRRRRRRRVVFRGARVAHPRRALGRRLQPRQAPSP